MIEDHELLISRTADHVRQSFAGDGASHDWLHVQRVWKTAIMIATAEGADLTVVQLAALLHDLDDWKFSPAHDAAELRRAQEWLIANSVPAPLVERVREAISLTSFKGALVPDRAGSLEGRVVRDADRLDALGAIGIARAFAYGGHRGRALYDPDFSADRHASFEEYQKSTGPTINHFYEKLLLLKDRMTTATGRQMAESRDAFMRLFLEQFFREWNGDPRVG